METRIPDHRRNGEAARASRRGAGRGRRAALLLLLAAACGRAPADRAADRVEDALPAEVKAQVDSGNAAYRRGDYRAALTHFREAARRGPEEPVAWYGVQMAASALGDRAAADSASERLRALTPAAPPAVHHPARPPRSRDPAAAST